MISTTYINKNAIFFSVMNSLSKVDWRNWTYRQSLNLKTMDPLCGECVGMWMDLFCVPVETMAVLECSEVSL